MKLWILNQDWQTVDNNWNSNKLIANLSNNFKDKVGGGRGGDNHEDSL